MLPKATFVTESNMWNWQQKQKVSSERASGSKCKISPYATDSKQAPLSLFRNNK